MAEIIIVETDPELSLEEICQACHITHDFLFELLEYGAIEPKGVSQESWRFEVQHLHRIQRVLHLQEDLEVNLSGAILACDLLEQIDEMQARIQFLEKITKI